jgi:tRNA G37 N-methylase Trm5
VDCASVDVLRRNIALNSLGQRVTALQADIRTLAGPAWPLPDVPRHQCDLVVATRLTACRDTALRQHSIPPPGREESSLP